MKTPVLTYNSERCKLLQQSVQKQIYEIRENAASGLPVQDNIVKLLRNLCYKLFTLPQMQYTDGKQYAISELCEPIQGLLRTGMIAMIHEMVQASETGNVSKLLEDCLFYELMYMLHKNPTIVYAALLYHHAVSNNNVHLQAVASEYLEKANSTRTIWWEAMYLEYTGGS